MLRKAAVVAILGLAAGCHNGGTREPSPVLPSSFGPPLVPPDIELSLGPGIATRSPAAPVFGYRLEQVLTVREAGGVVGANIDRFRLTVVRFGATEVRVLEGADLRAQIGSVRVDPLSARQMKLAIDFNTSPAGQMSLEFFYTGDDTVQRAVSVQLAPVINLAE